MRHWGLILVGALVVAGAAVVVDRRIGAGSPEEAGPTSALPACSDLLDRPVGAPGEDPARRGCVTDGGAAIRSYVFACEGLRDVRAPFGDEGQAIQEAEVIFLPDAGVFGVEGGTWRVGNSRASFARTPFVMLGPYRCDELRGLAHDGVTITSCALDGTPIDLFSTQGCMRDGTLYEAIGRQCSYFDYGTTATWEQWWIDGAHDDLSTRPLAMESAPTGLWAITPSTNRDDRCTTAPDDWEPSWRHPER